MSARLTRDNVAKVADLARLNLSEAELERYTEQLGAVLDLLLLFKEHIVEGPVGDELGLGVDQVGRG